ncbi:MAG: Cytochrome c5 [uncultured Thiotrichaceae bacterium]|uniref:Cytochrome c5 n=1 Tax=uncultured Thiotrichaceae bacterium TaxID=298394 RepID=A0A6S6TK19_9GAMM|nr:MAG: Cytochrome c5 [uncultured Thiotrichaceae bacterium]
MNTSNLTPTKILIVCLLIITLGILVFSGLLQDGHSASKESTAVTTTLPTSAAPQAETETPAPLVMTGLETSAEKKGEEKFIKFDAPQLQKGREVWLENCENCHAWGTAGAPIPMEADAWKDRVIKEKTTLYDHAINGFFGPGDTMMPARGGNDVLSDEQVKSAVDYMVALATYYIQSQTPENN